ncbi:MAG: hypothetical protein IH943_06195 [Acidobacteria bacterium]|nr:hypothetical protein [Acidobacteriota bacterium]
MGTPLVIPPEEAAELLGTSATALAMQRSRGVQPGSLAVKIGGRVRYDPNLLAEWVKASNPSLEVE